MVLKPDRFSGNVPLQNAGLSMQPRLLLELLGRWWSWAQHLQPLQSGLQHVADGAAAMQPRTECLVETAWTAPAALHLGLCVVSQRHWPRSAGLPRASRGQHPARWRWRVEVLIGISSAISLPCQCCPIDRYNTNSCSNSERASALKTILRREVAWVFFNARCHDAAAGSPRTWSAWATR